MTEEKITVANPISASVVERIVAYFVGMFVMIVPLLIAMSIMIATSSGGEDPPAGAVITFLLVLAVFLGFNLFLVISRAQTLGMYLMNLQVVDATTGKPLSAIRYIFLRGFVGQTILRIVPFYGLIDALFIFGQKRQTLHDMIAGSIVVRFDDATKAKLREGGMASSARNIEYQLAGIQYAPPTRLSIGLLVTVGVFFIVIPILSAIILVAINPARQLAEEKTQLANSISKPVDVAYIDGFVEMINNEKLHTSKVLTGKQFMSHTTDGGGELHGYFMDGSLQKISVGIGLSFGLVTSNYYYWDNKLIFVRKQEVDFPTDKEGNKDYDDLELVYESGYYFKDDKLIETRTKGARRWTSSEEINTERSLIDEGIAYRKLLMDPAVPYEK